jgi:hypothetical protein
MISELFVAVVLIIVGAQPVIEDSIHYLVVPNILIWMAIIVFQNFMCYSFLIYVIL